MEAILNVFLMSKSHNVLVKLGLLAMHHLQPVARILMNVTKTHVVLVQFAKTF